jgi:dihydroflavonol-4-reductase
MARTAVTGASGLLGGNLAVALLAAGHSVRATRRGSTRVEHLARYPIEWVPADLSDTAALTRAFDGVEWVFHCAAQVSNLPKPTPLLVEANVEGTRHVIDAVRRGHVKRLVHCSTVGAVGLSEDGRPCTEDSPWNFDRLGVADGYVTTKHWAEEQVNEAVRGGLDAVVVNPSYMLGPFDVKPSSGKMLVQIALRNIPSLTPGMNNFVDVRDVARGMILAAEKGVKGRRYILGGENLSYADAFRRMAAVAGVPPPKWQLPRALVAPLGWVGDVQGALFGAEPLISTVMLRWAYCQSFIFSSERAKRELGYTLSPLEGAFRDALTWFREARLVAA